MVRMFTTALLAELLRHGAAGLETDLVGELIDSVVANVGQGFPDFMRDAIAAARRPLGRRLPQ